MPLKPHRDRITFREIQDEAGRGDIFPANFLSKIVHLSAFLAHLSANQNLLAETLSWRKSLGFRGLRGVAGVGFEPTAFRL